MKKQFIITSDGSHTLFLPNLKEYYHSKHGAIAESQHIYINTGLKHCPKQEILILEIGFGTGLNTLLTFMENETLQKQITYHTIECYPLSLNEVETLNYPALLQRQELFKEIHQLSWDELHQLSRNFTLHKINTDLTQCSLNQTYDVIYFDAFAPEKQPEMWGEDIFKKIYQAMNPNAILTTYCIKGEIQRRLKSIGYRIEKLQGPTGGKREILRAIKPV